jgi:hypothetical protein
VKPLEPQRPADPRDGGREDCRCQQAQDVAQAVEAETRTEVALDKVCGEQSFTGIAKGEEDSAGGSSVPQKIGRDGCAYRAGRHRQSRTGPKDNKDASGDTGGGPEHGHATRSSQQSKAQPRS